MMTRTLKKSIQICVVLAALFPAHDALGAASAAKAENSGGVTPYSPPIASASSSKKPGAGYNSFNLSIPTITLARQAQGHVEYNMGGKASISIEAARMVRGEELSDQVIEESGDSLQTDAMQGALLISRYSHGPTMSGFYWAMGVGYRQAKALWRTSPEDNSSENRMSLADSMGKLNHDLVLAGTTGHGRFGWRYVGESFPIMIGAHLGVRHFNSTVKDVEDSKLNTDSTRISPTTDAEKKNLKRRMMSALEPGIEFGVAF